MIKESALSLNREKINLKYCFGAEIVDYLNFRRFLKMLKVDISGTKGVINFKQKGVFSHDITISEKKDFQYNGGLTTFCI